MILAFLVGFVSFSLLKSDWVFHQNSLGDVSCNDPKEILQIFPMFSPDQCVDVVAADGKFINPHLKKT